jgi:hypothetical protein
MGRGRGVLFSGLLHEPGPLHAKPRPILTKSTAPTRLSTLRPVTGFWPIFFLLIVLKIPVVGAIWLVWWAGQPMPEPEASEDSGGGSKYRRPGPKRPRGPRRGPHGGGAAVSLPPCPPGGRTRGVKPAAQPAFARAGSRAGTDRNRPRPYDA